MSQVKPAPSISGIVAIDVGGSGSRGAWVPLGSAKRMAGESVTVVGPRIRVTAAGVNHAAVVAEILDRLMTQLGEFDESCGAVCVGASGLLGLTAGAEDVHDVIRDRFPAARSLVASDAVTAAVGALGGRAGAVVAAGTGAIAMGTDLGTIWKRVDGWGHVLGDAGGGAWLGAKALAVALEQFDGRRSDAGALENAAVRRFGQLTELPRQIYTNDERAGLLASFVPDVVALSEAGHEPAVQLCVAAGQELAKSTAAAMVEGVPHRASWTGGLLSQRSPITEHFGARLRQIVPDLELCEPVGSPLDGAVFLAAGLAEDAVASPASLSIPPLAETPFASFREGNVHVSR
ncbi:N-acetylglucosamine kinase [Lysinibacter cavernae]|uniref:N-acetylglucosamine kinase-like BadF-type ATPase n=1 Tax=Lysinibacter cavernae TaxID=1640652 RepID=A0A7X5TTZ3_9MICO|nr:BadF/BadG/BcrA/BcrD ATPase family protein [Lysinibacter cavernae]NIH54039.1 N-acetylglucosamine kinase-like BadF-type ATPase [Lysinibacter cavernae]